MFDFFKPITITYGITVCNEYQELKLLLDVLFPLIDKNDEILILRDVTNPDQKVGELLEAYRSKVNVIEAKLNGDFATFKNTLIKNAKSRYLFQIDADEYPKEKLIKDLKWFLFRNRKADCFLIPRVNIVNGITNEYLEKWNWKKDKNNYINFPDFQTRLFKLNKNICWQNKIHEVLINYTRKKELPTENDDYCLVHIKEMERQKKQNAFYDTL
ncbi:glycosyltransferase [Chryseobacterium sp. MEBOG06]|uniref:glycosyltransferase n=1 Tax=Chryseobacterium sp. MEBOG06 TaxID=2879938 RepID=UPI001F181461|nr:glycosyltransferase [Chryseobacterium sp. MEBOG06]UKB83543.1 glycosyltransferase [Chryseobacterium sp. MEBOG06]